MRALRRSWRSSFGAIAVSTEQKKVPSLMQFSMDRSRRWFVASVALIASFAIGGVVACAGQPPVSDAALRVLAPTGSLRVGLYEGSPSSIVQSASPGSERGVGYDLGKALAMRLGVPFKPVVFPKNADVLAGMKAGTLDVTFTNASPERSKYIDFTPTFMDVEKSFLVASGSRLASIDDLHKPGLRVGVSEGSSTEGELSPLFPTATIVRVAPLKLAIEMLADGRLDTFATNKAILFEMSDALPGSRVLPGSWGLEHFAAGIPKGRESQLGVVSAFVDAALADGAVSRAVTRAGLRGVVAREKH
jgi:polar amino acid transport system substrate-binding protein